MDLEAIARFRAPPVPQLDQVVWRGVTPRNTGDAVEVAPGKWSFDAVVFTPWFVDEAQLQFRFRLVGFEAEWSALGANAVARYSSLPVGSYRLEAQAHTILTGYGEAVTLLRLHVRSVRWLAGVELAISAVRTGYEQLAGQPARNRALLAQSKWADEQIVDRTDALTRANRDLVRQVEELRATALTDPLTELGNRRHFEQRVALELGRAARSRDPIGFMLIDIDFFKRYNDHYGHAAGDECLRRVAHCIRDSLRSFDFVARYGGEEFAVLLPSAKASDLAPMGQRLCEAVRDLAVPHAGSPWGLVTISLGGTAIVGSSRDAVTAAMRRADQALYRGKELGRNRAIIDDTVVTDEDDLRR